MIFYDYNLLFIVQSGDIIFCCHVSYDLIGASYPQATAQTTTRFIQKEKNNDNKTMSHSNCHFPGGNGSCTYKMVSFQQHSFACWQIFGKIYITNLLLLVFYRLGQPIGLVPALHYITIFTPYKPPSRAIPLYSKLHKNMSILHRAHYYIPVQPDKKSYWLTIVGPR